MGFISGWGMWRDGTEFYPSFLDYDDFGKFQGLGPPWIYDKYLSDSINGFWMRDYDAVIRKDILKSLNSSRTDWEELFLETDGYKVAKALGTKARYKTT